MQRRIFLISTAAAFCGAIAWRLESGSETSAIAKVLYKRLDYLKLDDAGVRRFASDMAARKVISGLRLRVTDAAGVLYTRHSLTPDSKLGQAIRHGEDRMVTLYLMSSDFFANGANKNRTVNYLGYYDPLVACNNPFARPVSAPSAL